MAQLHEILAAEKTPTSNWNVMFEETLKKFGNENFFSGQTNSLKMLEESDGNKVLEAAAREDKPVTTNVYETLHYALGAFAIAEDVQFQKNKTNQIAMGTVMWRGSPLLADMPVDELLGLEARLAKIRQLMLAMPTIDASKNWVPSAQHGKYVWDLSQPEETSKTEKVMTPVILAPATDKHPAQVEKVTKDIVVGKFSRMKRSGAVTAEQKANTIKQVDELLVEVKKARMRANETQIVGGNIGETVVNILLEHLK
jgi:hypothetical protein